MVKVFALIPRRTDISEEHFRTHWGGPHAELALRITTLHRYVQSHRVDPSVAGLPAAPYDGIAEVWFTDVATAAGMGGDPNYAEHAHVDEPNFIDIENLAFVMTHEDVQRSGGAVAKDDGGVKAMLLLRRGNGISPTEFADRLAELGPALADAVPAALRVVVTTALSESYADGAEPSFDSIVEFRYGDVDQFVSDWGSGEAVLGTLADDIDLERSRGFLAEELRVLWPEDVAATA